MMKKFLFWLLLIPIWNAEAQISDISLLRKINLNRNTHLDNTFRIISNSEAAISISVPAIVLGVGYLKNDSTLKVKGFTIAASIILTSGVSTVLKHIVKRDRPYITYPDIEKASKGGSGSFPSGHTSAAFSTATSLSLAYPKWYVIVPSYMWAVTVAYSRMHLGVHYPSDVLAGALIGAGCAYLSYKGQQWLVRKSRK